MAVVVVVFFQITLLALYFFFFHIQGERNEKEECYVYGVLFHAFFFVFFIALTHAASKQTTSSTLWFDHYFFFGVRTLSLHTSQCRKVDRKGRSLAFINTNGVWLRFGFNTHTHTAGFFFPYYYDTPYIGERIEFFYSNLD